MPGVQNYNASPFRDFLHDNGDNDSSFAVASDHILRIDVDGIVYTTLGATITYTGDIKFKRLPHFREKGITEKAHLLPRPIMTAEGKGRLYCAQQGWHIRVLKLSGESVNVAAKELLAFEGSLDFEVHRIGQGISAATGGVSAVKLSGTGSLVIATHGDQTVIPVTAGKDLRTDPLGIVAWTEGLEPKLTVDASWWKVLGFGGEESIQMRFSGDGDVVVQPSEDPKKFSGERLEKKLKF